MFPVVEGGQQLLFDTTNNWRCITSQNDDLDVWVVLFKQNSLLDVVLSAILSASICNRI